MSNARTLTAPALDLRFIAPRRVAIATGHARAAQITLVGAGGTGSFLALHLARLAYHARQQHNFDIRLTVVDPDTVEERNIGRQNFAPAEVGSFKAQAVATRYGRAFGQSITFYNEALRPGHVDGTHRYHDGWLHLLIGAVDSPAARQDIVAVAKSFAGRMWWLDCGNHHADGQVLLGNSVKNEPEIGPLGCTGLPWPSVQHPELVQKTPAPQGHNCALDALADIQSLMINQQVAGLAASYVYRLLLARDLDSYATYIDLAANSMTSRYITGE